MMLAATAHGEFSASLTLSGNVADPNVVFPQTPIVITVSGTYVHALRPPDEIPPEEAEPQWYEKDDISRIQLNWADCTAGLNLTAATWTWNDVSLQDEVTHAILTERDPPATEMADLIVNGQSIGDGIRPAHSFTAGTLAFGAPAYNPGGGNTYALNLTGGSADDETCSTVADGDNYLLAPPNGMGLTLTGYSITVVSGGFWNGAGTPWQTAANWSSAMVPDASFAAVFDGSPPTNQPTLSSTQAARLLDFRTAGWTVYGTGQTLQVGAGGISSAGPGGSNTILPNVLFNADAAITVGTNHMLITANLNALTHTLSKEGPGALNAGNVTAGTFNVNTGQVSADTVTSNAFHVNDGPVYAANVVGSGPGAAVSVAADKGLTVAKNITGAPALTVNGTLTLATTAAEGTAEETSVLGSLAMGTNGQIDVSTGNLIVKSSGQLTQVRDWVKSGGNFSGGMMQWNGKGIMSTPAQADTFLYGVGMRPAAGDPNYLYSDMTDLEETPVALTDVVVKYTYAGDANLDGFISSADYDVIDFYYLFPEMADPMGWWNGDYNYDGMISSADYDLIDYAFLFQGGTLGGAGDLSAVPDPATLGLVALGLAALAARRRR